MSELLEKVYATWAIENDISRNAIDNLLRRAAELIPCLLGTPERTFNIKNIGNGQYYYFCLHDCLIKIIKSRGHAGLCGEKFDLKLGTDGADLGKSSTQNMWPVLLSNQDIKDVYMAVLFKKVSKPDERITSWRSRRSERRRNKWIISWWWEIWDQSWLFNFWCAAKIIHSQKKGHAGYDCCPKCKIAGEHVGVQCLPTRDASKQSVKEFRGQNYKGMHQATVITVWKKLI